MSKDEMAAEPTGDADLQRLVQQVLVQEWDQAGLPRIPDLLGRIQFMISDATVTHQAIAAYLMIMARDRFGPTEGPGLNQRCDQVAEALVALRPHFAGRQVTVEAAWCRRVAEFVVDALISANILRLEDHDRAVDVATEETRVRLSLNDRPPA